MDVNDLKELVIALWCNDIVDHNLPLYFIDIGWMLNNDTVLPVRI